jgi:carnitine O-octanoyltransferase
MYKKHTPFDGMVSTTATVYVLNKEKEMKIDYAHVDARFDLRSDLDEPVEIEFNYDLFIEKEIEKASKLFLSNTSKVQITTLILKNCDKNTLKSYKINPDTFSQMCMQLAYYQLNQKPAPTYETATTRAYYHGRTETVRSCSNEALEWCKAMCNKDPNTRLNNSELLALLKHACQKHDKLMDEARNNAGCDRHLLGLMLTARSLNLETPEIFTDPAFKKRYLMNDIFKFFEVFER